MSSGSSSRLEMEKALLARVKHEFEKSPLASNVVLGVILICLEKLVEMEFACPCNSKYNAWFASAFFVFPAVLVFLLMINIQCQEQSHCVTVVVNSLAPAVVWLILMFMDGRYFACAKTYWSGKFVVVTEAAPQKWCKPANQTSSQEFMIKTQEWFCLSQSIGMGCVAVLTALFASYTIYECCQKEKRGQETHYSHGQNSAVTEIEMAPHDDQ